MQDLYVNDGCSTKIPPGSSNFFVQYHHKRSRVQAQQAAVLVPSMSLQSHIGAWASPHSQKETLVENEAAGVKVAGRDGAATCY